MNVEVAVVVPVAAVNVTGTPVCQFDEVSVTVVGLAVIAVLPVRATLTVTDADGAALSRSVDVPVPPEARLTDVGLAMIDGCVVPPIVNDTAVLLTALSAGLPLSKAVAVAVCAPDARPVAAERVRRGGVGVDEVRRRPGTRPG